MDETKSGEPLELPLTRQLGAILERRLAERDRYPERSRAWVFPSAKSRSGRNGQQHAAPERAQSARRGERSSGFTRLRNCFITVADRELMLPTNLTKRLVNHARPQGRDRGLCGGLDDGAVARESAQRIADRIDALAGA